MRQVVLDTETTGIGSGHRVIEIACVELIDRSQGRTYNQRINPQRKVDEDAYEVHGISDEDLIDAPTFAQICDTFLDFVRGSQIIAHNAPFDIGILNTELHILKRGAFCEEADCQVLDTLELAQAKHPGVKNSLDALCKRYRIDLGGREKHGALIDAGLLAQVYLAMTSVQISLDLESTADEAPIQTVSSDQYNQLEVIHATEEECRKDQEYRDLYLKKVTKD